MRRAAGAAGGFACIGGGVDVESLAALLDDLEQGAHGLPKTILYTLNPADNAVMSVLSGSFIGVTKAPHGGGATICRGCARCSMCSRVSAC